MIKYIHYLYMPVIIALLFTSCLSTDEEKKTTPVTVITVPEPVPVPIPETKPVQDDEYTRSVSALGKDTVVTKDVFQEDKKAILTIISKLSDAMKNVDYGTWRSYIEPNSVTYWSDPRRLKKAAERLPIKGISLMNLDDYFKFVFIPSRANHVVDEIRYISDTSVKAVQVKGSTDIIYYNFVKIDSEWKVQLPSLES